MLTTKIDQDNELREKIREKDRKTFQKMAESDPGENC
jgi:hypothetical protein